VTLRTIAAGAVIVIAVAIIISTNRPADRDQAADDEGEPQEAVA
jgi:hypothetical protein